MKENTKVILIPQQEWCEVNECPKCKSTKWKWYLKSTKECTECKHVFRAEELIMSKKTYGKSSKLMSLSVINIPVALAVMCMARIEQMTAWILTI